MSTTQIKNGFQGGSDDQLLVKPDGSINASVDIVGLSAFATNQYLVATSPIQISIPSGTSSIAIKVKTTSGSDAVIIGNSNTVTNVIDGSGNGFVLYNGDVVEIDVTNSADVWIIGTSASQIVYVLFAGG